MQRNDHHDLAVASCQCAPIIADPVRHAIIAGRMFQHSLDAVPLDWQTRRDIQDTIDMIVAQLEGNQ